MGHLIGNSTVNSSITSTSAQIGANSTFTALTANSSGIFANTTLVANSTGPYGKTEGSLSVNNATYVGGVNLTSLNSSITANAATAYTNSTVFASNASNVNTGILAEARLPYRMDQNVRTTDTITLGNLTLTGNLYVGSNVNVIGANNLSIVDNMIYMNSNNTVANPDLGITGNYNDGIYHHAGFFRDASDSGTWKVFDNYLPEPDASPYIDTTNTTFHLANFQANTLYAGNTSTNWFVANTLGITHSSNTATFGTAMYIVANGNMGIGTTIPDSKLAVTGGRTFLRPSNEAYALGLFYGAGVNPVYIGSPAANSFQISRAGGDSVFYIDGSGNTGIGTTNPQYGKLHVNGKIYASDTIQSGNSFILQGNGMVTTNSSNNLLIGINEIEKARFDVNGRLSINTQGPIGSSAEKLTVNGMVAFTSSASSTGNAPLYVYNTDTTASNNQPFIYFHDGSAIRGQLGCNYTDGAMWINGAFGLRFRNNSGEIARFDSSGNLGINTTSPSYKLDVYGTVRLGYNGVQGIPSSTDITANTHTLLSGTGGNYLAFGQYGSAQSYAQWIQSSYLNPTTATYNLVLQPVGGNVGIGAITPRSKFTLKGRIRTIASPASSSYEENRWYSHEGHYNIASVDNNAYSNLLMFRPYQSGTTTDPPGSSLWTRVGVEVRIGGHSSAIGSGDRWARYSLDYNGSGCSGATTLQDLATTNAPRVNFSISGWQVTLQVSGAGGSAGSLGGYCYVSVHFGGGEGSYGEAIEWSLTEYL